MPRKLLKRFTPSPEYVRNHKSLAYIAHLLDDPNLFHLNRHSVSRAFAIGLGVSMLPVYGHLFIAAFLAIRFRANIPISVVLIWLSNPLTLPAIMLAHYWIGAQFLGIQDMLTLSDFSLSDWQRIILESWKPLLIGSTISSIVGTLVGYFGIQGLWQLEINRKWRKRLRTKSE